MLSKAQIIFIVGPTAIGKSDVAYHLAKKINGEIISCDSMQVYRDISIASNKISSELRKDIPHHLIDIISLDQKFDVALFNQLANQALQEILSHKKVPIVVGGSGLYIEILLDGIFSEGIKGTNLRDQIKMEIKEKGIEALYEELKGKDPAAVQRIHINDEKRIVRALEICRSTGQPVSEIAKNRHGWWDRYDVRILGLNAERASLYERIEKRVDYMFDQGLLEEIKSLQQRKLSLTAEGLIGIKEVLSYLRGEIDLERANYLLKLNTRHLAKKQLTWFRAEKRIEWIDITEKSLEQISQCILELLKKEKVSHVKKSFDRNKS